MSSVALVLVASSASAHDLGVSRSTLTEQADGTVHGEFTFATSEAPRALDPSGHVDIDIFTDGARCTRGLATEALVESDAIVIEEDFACTRATSSIEATVQFLPRMTPAHENIASLAAFGESSTAASEFLSGERRTIALELHRPRPKTPRTLIVGAAIASALILAVALRSVLRR